MLTRLDDLQGWVPANNGTKITPGSGFGPCPSIHHAAETGHFYVISGGHAIALSRTRDFKVWEHASAPLVTVDKEQWRDTTVSSYLGIAAQVCLFRCSLFTLEIYLIWTCVLANQLCCHLVREKFVSVVGEMAFAYEGSTHHQICDTS